MSHSRLSALAEAGRAVLGPVYAGGALVHLQFWLTSREMYAAITVLIVATVALLSEYVLGPTIKDDDRVGLEGSHA